MTTLRVVTFNTLFGGHDDFVLGTGDRWHRQIPFLKSLQADILALQECNFWVSGKLRGPHRTRSR